MSTPPSPLPSRQDADAPAAATDETWAFVLRHAVHAPSGHNTQPWRFAVHDDVLHLYADRSRGLPVVDPDDRALVISCGAVLAHVTVVLRHLGYAGEAVAFPDPADPDLLATVGRGRQRRPEPDDHELFGAIGARHTHRAAFDARPVGQAILTRLTGVTRRAGATLHVVTDDETRTATARLVAEGDRTQLSDAGFRRELAHWVRTNHTHRPDGMPGYAVGVSDLPSLLGPTVIATFDTGAQQARKDEQLALAAPALMVLCTDGDTPADWLVAGQAVAMLLLHATTQGLAASFLNQPVEVPELRDRLRDLLGGRESPQLLIRLGYGAPDRPTPRRAVADVLADVPPTSRASS